MNSWGVQFSNELVRCQARILQPKGILTGGARTEPRDGDWSRTMQSDFPLQFSAQLILNSSLKINRFENERFRQIGKLDRHSSEYDEPTSSEFRPIDPKSRWSSRIQRARTSLVNYIFKKKMIIHSLLNLIQLNSVSLENDRNNNYANALENELSNHHYDIVMCVLRSNRADTYKVIKNITFCRLGIASQV